MGGPESQEVTGLVFHGPDGRIEAASPGASLLLAVPMDALIGARSPLEFGEPFDEAGAPLPLRDCPSRRCLASLTAQAERVVRLERVAQGAIVLGIGCDPLLSAAGKLSGLVTRLIERTHRRRAEDLAREALQARDETIATVAHELRTPLTAIHLQLKTLYRLAQSGACDAESFAEKVQVSLRQSARMNVLVEELLDVARIGTGGLALERQPWDLAALVRDCVERTRPELERAGCTVHARIGGAVYGEWDTLRLEQVVTNLLSNAARYGPGRPVEVEVRGDGREAMVAVRDYGIGIQPEDQARIFERFERAVTRSHSKGLGIGLWLVREIVEAHRGRVEVSSRPGEGATFRVWLPVSSPKDAAAGADRGC